MAGTSKTGTPQTTAEAGTDAIIANATGQMPTTETEKVGAEETTAAAVLQAQANQAEIARAEDGRRAAIAALLGGNTNEAPPPSLEPAVAGPRYLSGVTRKFNRDADHEEFVVVAHAFNAVCKGVFVHSETGDVVWLSADEAERGLELGAIVPKE